MQYGQNEVNYLQVPALSLAIMQCFWWESLFHSMVTGSGFDLLIPSLQRISKSMGKVFQNVQKHHQWTEASKISIEKT